MPPAALDPEGDQRDREIARRGPREVKPESEKDTGQAPPEDISTVPDVPVEGDRGGAS